MSTTQKAVVGVFVAVTLALFAAGLFLIGDRRLLFDPQFPLETDLNRVTGIQVGTVVRIDGLPAGEVLEIVVPPRPSEAFRVRMRVREALRPLVREDSVASVHTDGIVGSTFIQIDRGTDDSPIVEPGGRIPGQDPIEFADLIEEGRDTFRTLAAQITQLTDDLSGTMASLGDTTQRASALVVDLTDDLRAVADVSVEVANESGRFISDARGVLADVRAGRGTIGQLLTDDAAYRHVVGVVEQAEQTVGNLREATAQARSLIEGLSASEGTAQEIVGGLRATLVETREVMSDLSESTEALKRNFLVRGFFQDRGFFDLDAVSREAYLSGALAGNDRTALRVWIDADVLFVSNEPGVEQLTDAGRRRIEIAMADFMRYPRDSPLVVEGYRTGDDGVLRSLDRATVVQEYVVQRFRRDVTLTGIMPLGADAPASPRGDGQWAGVALTLFVRTDALTAR